MKLTKSLLLGATILTTALCSCGSSCSESSDRHDLTPAEEGRKLARLQNEFEKLEMINSFDSEEVQEASERFQRYDEKMVEKFTKDTTGSAEFADAYITELMKLREEAKYQMDDNFRTRSPEDDGTIAAVLAYNYSKAQTSEEREKINREYTEFYDEAEKLYGNDEDAMQRFIHAFNMKFNELNGI